MKRVKLVPVKREVLSSIKRERLMEIPDTDYVFVFGKDKGRDDGILIRCLRKDPAHTAKWFSRESGEKVTYRRAVKRDFKTRGYLYPWDWPTKDGG